MRNTLRATMVSGVTAILALSLGPFAPASAGNFKPSPWLHYGPTGHYKDCGMRRAHNLGQFVWGGNGNTSALICRNGKAFTS